MRICAVSLPELRVELVRAEMASRGTLTQAPLAVVVAPMVQGEATLTEQKLLGNTRLSVVSREARALGVLPGQTIAQARARAADLAVRVVRPDAVRDVLARLAEVALAFGATVSFGMEGEPAFERTKRQRGRAGSASETSTGAFGDVVWVDVTGCAHLHEPASSQNAHAGEARGELWPAEDRSSRGEYLLAARLARVISSLGHTCAVAIADGPRVAAMLARSMFQPSTVGARSRSVGPRARQVTSPLLLEPLVVRPGENARAIAHLPVAALPLPAEDVRWLAKIGVRTIGELRDLPPEGLGTRLGAHARDVLSLAAGDDRAPLAPYVPPVVPEEEVELEYGIDGAQALTFVAKTLSDRLASRLQGRAVAAARVELELRLDAAMLDDAMTDATPANDAPATTSAATKIVGLDLPAALSGAGELLAALRPKIERLELPAPVLGAKLRAPVLVHRRAVELSLFEAEPKAERALPRLVAELVSDLGEDCVSTLALGDSWVPEDRSRLVPFGRADGSGSGSGKRGPAVKKPRRHMTSSVPEPTRLYVEPRVVSRDAVRVTRHLARLEAVEWWKALPGAGKPTPRVDFVQAWTDEGEAWVEIDRATGTTRVRGWFD